MLADELDYVLGVDARATSTCSRSWRRRQAPLSPGRRRPRRGRLRDLVRAARRRVSGRRGWAIEGTGSYGAGLAGFLGERGEVVLEVGRTPRGGAARARQGRHARRRRGSACVLASDRLALPRAGERREALRLLLVARRSAVDVRREALTQLRAVIVTAPDGLRQELRGLPLGKLLDRCRRLRQTRAAG